MENKFSDHNDFDKYAREQDNWIYDNGWKYKEEHYSSYRYDESRFSRVDRGYLVDYIVMLRDDKNPSKTIVLHGIDKQFHEIWSGFINSQNEYQSMMSAINNLIEEYKINSGAT